MFHFSDKVKSLRLSAIKRLTLLGKEHPDPIFLSWGRPCEATPELINQYTIKHLKDNPEVGKYTPPFGLKELRDVIAEYHLEHRGIQIDPDKNIIVTAGAMEAMFIIMQTILNPGDEVLMTSPGFTSYRQHITLANGTIKYIPLSEEKGWDLNLEGVEDLITDKTRAIIVTSPNNPTGSVFSKDTIKKLVEIAKKNDIYIISDEIYDFLTFDNTEYFVPSMMQNEYDKIINVYSLSKRYSMTGWRVGYIVANEEIIKNIVKVHDAATICACSIAQHGAIAALTNEEKIVPEIFKAYERRRELICSELDTLPEIFSYVKPQGAYYIFPKIEAEYNDTEEFAIKLIKETGVVTVPGDAFGPDGEGHLRMVFCISDEKIKEAFDRLRKYFKK